MTNERTAEGMCGKPIENQEQTTFRLVANKERTTLNKSLNTLERVFGDAISMLSLLPLEMER